MREPSLIAAFQGSSYQREKGKNCKNPKLKINRHNFEFEKIGLFFFFSFVLDWEGVVSLTFFRALQCRGRGGKNEKKEKNGRRKYIIEVLFDNVLKIIIFILFLE